jgi:hypothetical protein
VGRVVADGTDVASIIIMAATPPPQSAVPATFPQLTAKDTALSISQIMTRRFYLIFPTLINDSPPIKVNTTFRHCSNGKMVN